MKINPSFPVFYAFLSRWAGGLAIGLAAFFMLSPAQAAPLTPAEEISIRSVVEGQLAALAKDDAVKAFSFAAPNVRKTVGTAPQFLALVRNSYPALYRPVSVAFLKPEAHHGQALQRVQVTDASGNAWLAAYSVQRQKDNTWRITGCSVVANKGRMA